MDHATQFLEQAVMLLVEEPAAVRVERTTDEMGVLLTLTVAGPDMGRVLGRQGMTATALRTLLRAIGAKDQQAVHLRINDPNPGKRGAHSDAEAR